MSDPMVHYGFLSIIPAIIAVVLAFITREATFSLLLACIVGLFITGEGLWGLPGLFEEAMGNADFIWVLLIEVFIGVLVAFFQLTGSTEEFGRIIQTKITSRKKIQLFGWFLGIFIFFSDYFSPLFTGPVMRNLTDKAKISREKLAYIIDSTSAPMCVLVPFSAWGIYISGLLIGYGPLKDTTAAVNVFFKSVGFNFYGIFTVLMVALIAIGVIPDFGPMRKAEERALKEGKLVADGSTPMMGVELSDIKTAKEIKKPRIFINFIFPVIIVIAVALGTYILLNTAKTLEAFMLAVFVLGIAL